MMFQGMEPTTHACPDKVHLGRSPMPRGGPRMPQRINRKPKDLAVFRRCEVGLAPTMTPLPHRVLLDTLICNISKPVLTSCPLHRSRAGQPLGKNPFNPHPHCWFRPGSLSPFIYTRLLNKGSACSPHTSTL